MFGLWPKKTVVDDALREQLMAGYEKSLDQVNDVIERTEFFMRRENQAGLSRKEVSQVREFYAKFRFHRQALNKHLKTISEKSVIPRDAGMRMDAITADTIAADDLLMGVAANSSTASILKSVVRRARSETAE